MGAFPQSDSAVQDSGSWWKTSETNAENNRPPLFRGFTIQLLYVLIDVACVFFNGALALWFRFAETDGHEVARALRQSLNQYSAFFLLYAALIILCCEWKDLYRTPRTRTARYEAAIVIHAVSLATLILTAFIYLSAVKIVSRLVVGASFVLNVSALTAWRYAKRRAVISRVERGIGARNVAIVGAGRVGQALARQIDENKFLGYRFKGFLDSNRSGEQFLGTVEDLPRIASLHFLDEIVITIPSERELVKRIALEGRQLRLHVKVVPDLYDGLISDTTVHNMGTFPVMDLYWKPIPTFGLFFKRMYDVAMSTLVLILTAPIVIVAALWIRFDSPGPVLYSSPRVGKKGQIFTCYKLRTMVVDADDLKQNLRHRNERKGPFFKISADPRITRSGKFLRKYSLDELPQLWNVLKGDMSLIGPRPHPIDDFAQYDLGHLRRLEVKPGITGLWQVIARQDPSFERSMRLDIEYIESWNLLLDIRITIMTLFAVVRGNGT